MVNSLDCVADALLAEHGALGKDAGCYTDDQIAKQDRRRDDLPLREELVEFVRPGCLMGILWRSMESSLIRSRCPDRAVECLRLCLLGFPYRDIEPRVGVSRSTIARDVHVALAYLRRDDYLGLIEVLCEVFHLSRHVVRHALNGTKRLSDG